MHYRQLGAEVGVDFWNPFGGMLKAICVRISQIYDTVHVREIRYFSLWHGPEHAGNCTLFRSSERGTPLWNRNASGHRPTLVLPPFQPQNEFSALDFIEVIFQNINDFPFGSTCLRNRWVYGWYFLCNFISQIWLSILVYFTCFLL